MQLLQPVSKSMLRIRFMNAFNVLADLSAVANQRMVYILMHFSSNLILILCNMSIGCSEIHQGTGASFEF